MCGEKMKLGSTSDRIESKPTRKHPLRSLPLQPPEKIMCGIVAAHGIANPASERQKYIACAKKVRHRGPDWSGCYVGQRSILAHERLAVVGVGGCASYILEMAV